MNHAIVTRDGHNVPLIGIPMSSTLERCDRCGDEEPLREVRYTGRQFLCSKCDFEFPISREFTRPIGYKKETTMKKLMAVIAAALTAVGIQAVPFLTADVLHDPHGFGFDSLEIRIFPHETGSLQGNIFIDGVNVGRGTQLDSAIDSSSLDVNLIPPYFALGPHTVEMDFNFGQLFASYFVDRLPQGIVLPTPPTQNAPDAGATAALLGIGVAGIGFLKRK